MKSKRIDIIDININFNNNKPSYISKYNDNNEILFIFKHLFNKYNIIFNKYIKKEDIEKINNLFYEDIIYENNKINYKHILIYNNVSSLFIYYYIFLKKYILQEKKLNIFDMSLINGFIESILYNCMNNNYRNIYIYKLYYLSKFNDSLYNNLFDGYHKITNIYKDLKNHNLNLKYLYTDYNLDIIENIINEYKTKEINLCHSFYNSIKLKYNNIEICHIFNNFIMIYIFLNILNEDGMIILTLDYNYYDYYLNIFTILNSLFDIHYPKFLSNYRRLIILKNYKKNIFKNNYQEIFEKILKKIDNHIKTDNKNINNIFDKMDNNKFFHKMFIRFNNDKYLDKINQKINKICNKIDEKCYNHKNFIKLLQILYDKYYLTNIKLCEKYKLEVRPDMRIKYNEIVDKLKKQLYSMNYDNIYTIDNNNNNFHEIRLNTNTNNNFINLKNIFKNYQMI